MAISFTQIPQLYTPAYNRNQFVALSTLAAANNDFIYKVEVLTPLGLATYDYPKRPDNYGVFDVSEVVRNAIKHTFNPNLSTPYLATSKSIEVTVSVTEYYGGSAYGQASYDYFAFDACLLLDDFYNYDFQQYVSGYAFPISFLSDNPVIPQRYVNLDNDVWLSFYLGTCEEIELRIFDETNTLVGALSFSITSPQPTEIYTFNVGNRTTTAGGYPLNNNYRTQIVFIDGSSNVIATRQYIIREKCSKFQRITAYYLKRCGAIGFFTFDKLNQKSISKSTSDVRHSRMFLDSNENYTYNTYDRESHVVSTLLKTRITLNSDWITDDQSKELAELFDSPIVWLSEAGAIENLNYVPIKVIDTDYQINKTVNQKLFNYTLTAEYSQQESRQRGI